MTSRAGGTGCRAHVPSARGVSWWKGTSWQCQIRGGSAGECAHSRSKAQHRPSLILILALLHTLGQTRIIPSPHNVQESADFLQFSGQDTQLLCWVMDICEGCCTSPLSSLHVALLEGAPLPALPALGTARELMEGQDSARLDGRLSPGLRDTCHPLEEAEKWFGNSRSISLLL